jgi:DNA-binding beta-propeller fold protein YncE
LGQFHKIQGLAFDKVGRLYVADGGNYRVQVLDNQLNPLGYWGHLGTNPGTFNGLSGLALDLNGFLYVADSKNDRVEKFAAFRQN